MFAAFDLDASGAVEPEELGRMILDEWKEERLSIAFITTTRCVAPYAVPSILLTTKHQPRPQLEAVGSLLRASCLQ